MNIESKLWKAVSWNDMQVTIIQKASGQLRTFSRSALPSVEALAAMHERAFDRHLREVFHEGRP